MSEDEREAGVTCAHTAMRRAWMCHGLGTQVHTHAPGLVEGANHVLAQRVVHARLAAHAAVHLGGRGMRFQVSGSESVAELVSGFRFQVQVQSQHRASEW